ncbi:hypothetical protein GBA52_024945, partial [Prunus armeniaca]
FNLKGSLGHFVEQLVGNQRPSPNLPWGRYKSCHGGFPTFKGSSDPIYPYVSPPQLVTVMPTTVSHSKVKQVCWLIVLWWRRKIFIQEMNNFEGFDI